MGRQQPLITVITVCYNAESTIEDTIKSVISQEYQQYEHLIIDGASTDETLEIVNRYEKLSSTKLLVVSEKDKGIYDAMNKGVSMASGDIIGILNADDYYKDGQVLGRVAKGYCCGSNVIYGDSEIVGQKDTDKVIRMWKAGCGRVSNGWIMPHPTTFVSKNKYIQVGKYNLKYRISADYDFMVRLLKVTGKKEICYIPKTLVTMRDGGISNSGVTSVVDGYKQINKILKENGYRFRHYVNCMRLIRKLGQYIRR